ncbi:MULTISPECIES: hypothetical protein [unclassified Sphingobacterium]|uniref:hypothetical protein n=1 Tax=unclassified Sphingobacterium TaxID=2609468 RepID=UPI00104BB81B|nr:MULTISPECIES: hypothetical protein [unclassified Sphingobacterium]MCS3554197.1 hypothetical protein [Sphingobacterium sp. JUb21]TCR08030.1 hypothetical protein EDF66_104135 [Sphingobacterium sp. JUb20]
MEKLNSEQDRGSRNFTLLDICCQELATKLGNVHISEWKNSDYVRLSALLRRETKVLISENTLKRIFGKLKTPERYYPQKATRDALALFIGYRDWLEFENVQRAYQESESTVLPEINKEQRPSITIDPKPIRKRKIIPLLFLLLFVIAIIIFLFWPTRSIQHPTLHCVNPIGHTPHSAIFKLSTTKSDALNTSDYEIDFKDWKKAKDSFLDSTVTHYYELPGVYYPTLLFKNKVIDTTRVYLQTRGWEVTAYLQADSFRVYPILKTNIGKNLLPNVTMNQVHASGIDTLHTFFTNYSNLQPSDLSGDNMQISMFVKTSPNRPGVRCSQFDITIYGEKDSHALSIMKPECTSWCHYKFSEQIMNGKSKDLRFLGHDLTKGGQFTLRIKNKFVTVLLDGHQVFETKYEKSIGKVLGINLMFSGVGTFSDYSLTGH